MSTPTQEQLEQLFDEGRYAEVLHQIDAGTTDAGLRGLRDDAHGGFEVGRTRILDTYKSICGQRRSRPQELDQLQAGYRGHIGAIDSPCEAEAYGRALLDEARQLAAENADQDRALACVYAAETLPALAPDLQGDIERLRVALEPVGSGSKTTLVFAKVQPPTDNHHAADRPTYETMLLPETQAREEKDAQVLATLNELVADLSQPRANLADIKRRCDIMQPMIARTPHEALWQRIDQQVAAHEEAVAPLNRMLGQSLRVWLDPPALQPQAETLLQSITKAFDATSPLVTDLRAQLARRVNECNDATRRMKELADLTGETLTNELADLEALLGADYPPLGAHQQRRTQYETEQKSQQVATASEQVRAKHRGVRARFDAALRGIGADKDKLSTLRQEALAARDSTALDASENPMDPETFAYYDILRADYLYRTDAEQLVAARTAANEGDYLKAVKSTQEHLDAIEKSDDQRAYDQTKHQLEMYREALLARSTQEVEKALSDAQQQLEAHDYVSALTTLDPRKSNLEYINQELPFAPAEFTQKVNSLMTDLEPAIERAAQIKAQAEQANALAQQARDAAAETNENRDFPQAIGYLKQAIESAPWRKAELEETIRAFREGQDSFVKQMLSQTDTHVQGERYAEAETCLTRAERNAHTEEQRKEITKWRTEIIDQQENINRFNEIRDGLVALLNDALEWDNIALVQSRIVSRRTQIGPGEAPRFDTMRWAELDTLLGAAEGRVTVWKQYIALRRQAETVAMSGDEEQVRQMLQQMKGMSAHTFLPIQKDEPQVRRLIRAGDLAERARQLLRQTHNTYSANEHAITVEELDRIAYLTSQFTGAEYADIVDGREFLVGLRPLYVARAEIKGHIEDSNFDQVVSYIETLPDALRGDAKIQEYKRKAEQALARQQFDRKLQEHLAGLSVVFEHAWDDPVKFGEKIAALTDLANACPELRKTTPRLDDAALVALNNLAAKVHSSRRLFNEAQYAAALNSLDTVLVALPKANQDDHPLVSYSNELNGLWRQIQPAKEAVERQRDSQKKSQNAFDSALNECQAAITDERCFNRSDLQKVINALLATRDPRAETYVRQLRAIIETLDQVEKALTLVISGTERTVPLDQCLAEASRRSNAIREPGSGAEDWPGIDKYLPYQILKSMRDVAEALDRADKWLKETKSLPRATAHLNELKKTGDTLKDDLNTAGQKTETGSKPQLESSFGDYLKQIQQSCDEKRTRIHKRIVDEIEPLLQKQQGNHSVVRTLAMIALVIGAIAGIIWNVPTLQSVEDQIVVAVSGTSTPRPLVTATPTLDPDTAVVSPTWTAVVVTATPEPTPTPVLPQAGVVIFPGQAWIYNRPSLDSNKIDFIRGGIDVEITGFTDDADGSRWYRFDAPEMDVRSAWLLKELNPGPPFNQISETLRILDNDGVLNEALFIPFDAAMQ